MQMFIMQIAEVKLQFWFDNDTKNTSGNEYKFFHLHECLDTGCI